MTDSHDELLGIARDLEQLAARGGEPEIREPLDRLKQATEEVGKAWSGSWLRLSRECLLCESTDSALQERTSALSGD